VNYSNSPINIYAHYIYIYIYLSVYIHIIIDLLAFCQAFSPVSTSHQYRGGWRTASANKARAEIDLQGPKGAPWIKGQPFDPTKILSKIEWDLTSRSLRKLLELLDTQVFFRGPFSGSCWRFLGNIRLLRLAISGHFWLPFSNMATFRNCKNIFIFNADPELDIRLLKSIIWSYFPWFYKVESLKDQVSKRQRFDLLLWFLGWHIPVLQY